jgi:ribose transport system ATP-binding protein
MIMENNNILEIKDIEKDFFGFKVLKSCNLSLKRGEILGLVGENGAGKSTLMNILGGVITDYSGNMFIDNNLYKPLNPKEALKAGIGFIHQELCLFSNLTIADNMFINDLPTNKLQKIKYKEMQDQAKEILDRFNIDIKPNAILENLPMGIRQIIEIAKVIKRQSKIIIFDEPTTSLTKKEIDRLFSIIKQLKDENASIIYISHILDDVFYLCDRVTVLRSEEGNSITRRRSSGN